MREPQSNQYGLDLFYLGNLRKCVWLLTALVVGSCTHDVTEIEDTAVVKVAVSSKTQARKAELDRMAAFRKKQSYDQTDVWHRFKTDDGQKIDCVDFYAQPAFKLVNGIGRMPPTPPDPVSNDGIDIEVIPELDTAPTLDEDGREQRCPEGSVPIPRWELKDLARFEKLNEYLRKPSVEAPNTNVDSRALDSTVVCGDNHCHAVAGQDLQNLGAETMINIWKPFVEDPEMEFSLSQLWLVRGGQRLEAGVHVMPKLYDGDTNPHLFTYFLGVESDHYECPDHGCECYNNVPVIRNGNLENCGAFLCSNPWICPGYRLTSWSQLGGQQVVLNLRFEYCSEARCDIWAGWWLRFANTWVGFYPKVLFNSSGLSDYAGRIQFGGEVMSYADGRITNTDMGSGILPSSECSYFFSCFGQVAYQRAIQYIDMSLNMQTPVLDDVRMDRPECYDIHKDYSYWLGRYIFFGGPGYSSTCL